MKSKTQRLRRGVYLLPSLLTVSNLLCGYYSILSSTRGTHVDLDTAAKLIGVAVVLDGLDGRVARMSNVSSPFGKEFDSLADVISFGIAPAFLALMWGLRGLDPAGSSHPALVSHIYRAGWIATFLFVICGAWRLARFNIQSPSTATPDAPAHRFFVGLPIPAAAGVIAAVVHALKNPITEWYWAGLWMLLVAGLSFLMVSTIRYYSFKEIDLGRRRPTTVVVGIAFVVSTLVYSEVVLLSLALLYLFSGLVGLVRRRLFSHSA